MKNKELINHLNSAVKIQTEFSLDFLLKFTGCYKKSKITNLFPKDREVVSYKDILQSNIPLQDKYWFFCYRCFTNSQNQHLAILIAEFALPIFEEKYPQDNRPRKAIEAARLYLAGKISIEELEAARAAARAAAWATAVSAEAAEAAVSAEAAWDATRAAAWATAVSVRATMVANPKNTKGLEELLINFIEENK